MEAITRSRAAAADEQAYTPVGTNTNPIETLPSSPVAPTVATSGEDL